MSRSRISLLALILGPLIAFSGAVTYFQVFARFPALRDVPWLNLPWVLLGAGISLWGLRGFGGFRWPGKTLAVLSATLSLALAGLFGAYIFYLSYQLPEPGPVGLQLEQAPEFSLPDHRGQEVSLADLRGSKVVLTFYRGHW